MGGAPERGRVDRLLTLVRLAAAAAGCTRRALRAFLLLDDPKAQAATWDSLLDTWRCRALLAAGFSPAVLRLAYAEPFTSVLPRPFGEHPPGHTEPHRPAAGTLTVERAEAADRVEWSH